MYKPTLTVEEAFAKLVTATTTIGDDEVPFSTIAGWNPLCKTFTIPTANQEEHQLYVLDELGVCCFYFAEPLMEPNHFRALPNCMGWQAGELMVDEGQG